MKRHFRRFAFGFSALLVLGFVFVWLSSDHFASFGAAPDEATLARMRASPQFHGDHFENREPTGLMKEGAMMMTRRWLFGREMRAPICPLPIASDTAARLAQPPASGLRITWLGHSTTLIELDGKRVLTDPMWSERASPSRWVGPKRFHPPPLPLAQLPPIDAVVISHEHFDHLDMETVRALAQRGATFHVVLGIAAHLRRWGVAPARIVEHDWWQADELGDGVRVVSTPARHFSGRGVPFRVAPWWTSWTVVGPKHRVYFSGDTGFTDDFREIATRLGPFDVALLEIGQYHSSWGDIHLGPAGALEAAARLKAKRLFPIHWATFLLSYHPWSEPAETLFHEAAKIAFPLLTPRLGEPAEPSEDKVFPPWWRAYPPLAATCPARDEGEHRERSSVY